MATPVGHALFGLTCAIFLKRNTSIPHKARWYILAIIAANAPDFDFIPGLLLGDINLYHQSVSHTVMAAIVFSLLCIFLASSIGISKIHAAMLGFFSYMSHLILDMFTHDGRPPYGIPFLWPFDQTYMQFPLTLLRGVKHGVPGDSLSVVISNILSTYNFATVVLEILVVTPVLVLAVYFQRKSASKNRTATTE